MMIEKIIPMMLVEKPMAVSTIDTMMLITATTIPRVHAQPFPPRNPMAITIETIPNTRARAPRAYRIEEMPLMVPNAGYCVARLEDASAAIPMNNAPAAMPASPPRISNTARTVTPVGRFGFGCISRLALPRFHDI